MGYFEVSIESNQWVNGYFEGSFRHKYCADKLTKKVIDCIWHFIRNDKLMSAKQKIVFHSCTKFVKGDPVPDWLVDRKLTARNLFERYCQQLRRSADVSVEIVFNTPRHRSINVNIKYEEKGEILCLDITK